MSSVFDYSTWQEIDNQLRGSTPAFNGFDGLCGKLGLPAREGSVTSSFHVSAELPAQFANIHGDLSKGTLEMNIECTGAPDLMIEWLPQHEFERVPAGWNRKPTGIQHHVLRAVPAGATGANLILSFAGLDAYAATHDFLRKETKVPASRPRTASTDKSERWKRTGKTLGEGGQGQVQIVEDTQNEYPGQWALKRLRNIDDPKATERFGQEVKALQSIKHPHILKIIHSDLAAAKPYYVAEYCEGGSLQAMGAPQYKGDIIATMRVLLPIVDAIGAAHQAVPSVIHRDIKPANILFRKDGTPVIGDFGICFIEGAQGLTSVDEAVGARHFIAPEMESGGRHLGPPTDRTDVYSIGKLLYWMLSGGLHLDRERHRDNPLVKLLNEQRWDHVHSLLDKMVTERPEDRFHSNELKERLQTVAFLVAGDLAPLSPSIGIRCRFCGIGSYERAFIYAGSHLYSHLGLPPAGQSAGTAGGETALLRCGHCGHIEFFQLKGIACKGWWDR